MEFKLDLVMPDNHSIIGEPNRAFLVPQLSMRDQVETTIWYVPNIVEAESSFLAILTGAFELNPTRSLGKYYTINTINGVALIRERGERLEHRPITGDMLRIAAIKNP